MWNHNQGYIQCYYLLHQSDNCQPNMNIQDVEIARYVMQDGLGCRIPVRSNWNLDLFDSLCTSRSDKEVATFLRFGWPIDRNANIPMTQTYFNHDSANRHHKQVTQYVFNELKHGTLLGPFVSSPFTHEQTGISPLSTRPKRNSSKRRIIMDLSWPHNGISVNAGIDKNKYLGSVCQLTYPTVDALCYRVAQLVKQYNKPIYGWKKDMSQAFKQVPLDPALWGALGFCFMVVVQYSPIHPPLGVNGGDVVPQEKAG